MNGRLNRGSVILGSVTGECLEALRQDRSRARLRDKDVLAVFRRSQNRRRVIKGADIDAQSIRPALESQSELGPAPGAKMNVDVLATAFRRHCVYRWIAVVEGKCLAFENGLDHAI